MKANKSGFTLVEILIVVAIIALLAGIAIPNLMRVRIQANDMAAVKVLKALSTATDLYCNTEGAGAYPTNMTSLVGATPPYINTDYCGATATGYSFTCTNSTVAYTYVATPVTVGSSGTTTHTITTGGILTP